MWVISNSNDIVRIKIKRSLQQFLELLEGMTEQTKVNPASYSLQIDQKQQILAQLDSPPQLKSNENSNNSLSVQSVHGKSINEKQDEVGSKSGYVNLFDNSQESINKSERRPRMKIKGQKKRQQELDFSQMKRKNSQRMFKSQDIPLSYHKYHRGNNEKIFMREFQVKQQSYGERQNFVPILKKQNNLAFQNSAVQFSYYGTTQRIDPNNLKNEALKAKSKEIQKQSRSSSKNPNQGVKIIIECPWPQGFIIDFTRKKSESQQKKDK